MQRRSWFILVLPALAGGVGGCQSYEPRPLDLEGHRAAWLSREAGGPAVAAFAESLSGPAGAAGFDPSDGLSVAEAEVVALFYNPELRMARLRAGVTAANAGTAGAWTDPELSADGARILESVADPWKIFAMVGFTLPVSGRLEAERARAGAEHAAELARIVEQEWAVRIAVREAWAEWSAAAAAAGATEAFVARLHEVVAIAQRVNEAGELSRAELLPFLTEQATRRADLQAARARAAEGKLAIRALLGLSPGAPLELTPSLAAAEVGEEGLGIGADAPLLAVAAAEYEVAERALALEVREQYPDVVVSPGYGNEEGMSQVLLGVRLPLPVFNANRQGIADAAARRELARGAYETAYEGLAARLALARAKHAAAAGQRAVLEAEVVPLVDAQYESARQIAELGEVNTLLLLDSLTRQHEMKVRVVEARLAEALAAARVRALLGPAGGAGGSEQVKAEVKP